MKPTILKLAALHALATAAYISLLASCIFYSSHIMRIVGAREKEMVLIPIAMLLLFVFSAGLTGSLVLGRPILWYIDGNKKEAVSLLMATLGCLFVLVMIAFSLLAILSR